METAATSDRLLLKPLTVGSRISGAACVRRKAPGQTRDGAPYLTIELANASGAATAKVWREHTAQWDAIAIGAAVHVECVVKAGFKGGPPELDITTVHDVGEHEVRFELNAISAASLSSLQARHGALLQELPPHLLALHDVVLNFAGADRYWTAPAAKGHHHAYIRGLAEHSIEVAEIALRASDVEAFREHVDNGALVLGALLHDLGKVREYQWDGPIDISLEGRLRHHTSIGAELVSLAAVADAERLREAGCQERDILHLQHVQHSHHGKPEWGSSVEPASLEATLIHLADMTSARARAVIDDLTSRDPDAEGWVQPTGFRKRPIYYTRAAARSSSEAATREHAPAVPMPDAASPGITLLVGVE